MSASSIMRFCCCATVSPCVSGVVTMTVSIDSAACPFTTCYADGLLGYKNAVLGADGSYQVTCNVCPPAPTISFSGNVTVSGLLSYESWNAFAGVCTTFKENISCNQLGYVIQLDCNDVNARGMPRVLDIRLRVFAGGCTPAGGNFALFSYRQSIDGGTYYVGDAVPNKITASCGDNAGTSFGLNTFCNGGTVTLS